MNDQSQMMNQSKMANESQMMRIGQPLPSTMGQPQQVMNNQNSQMFVNQLMNPSQMVVSRSQPQGMLNHEEVATGCGLRSYGIEKQEELEGE
ncbi:hypothetical protein L1887_15223 [Cichorium endivia]|nr:hypothetical protein L1887_15223 [Cichorium endivia]